MIPSRAVLILSMGLGVVVTAYACKPRQGSSLKANDGGQSVSDVEIGREIWYKSALNYRFHTHTAGVKLGAPQDWFRVLRSDQRNDRFKTWGMINDPDCKPGNASSYFLDICEGDEGPDGLLAAIGVPEKERKWKDPGCSVSGSFNQEDCDLGFGTSTGAMGYRKFPNPRFDKQAWAAHDGWNGFDPFDDSMEPPIMVGTSCGSCHIAFNPLNPPADPEHPSYENLHGLVGNQYAMVSEIIGSGLKPDTVEWQSVIHARQGTVDTSAHPHDGVDNPGTINAIINIAKRPNFTRECPAQYENPNECLRRGATFPDGFGILKGGEDDVGGSGAILRVYVNIGLCAEQCWTNHLKDNRTVFGRGSAQTPFDIKQCQRDCGGYRALDKYYTKVLQFFAGPMGRQTDLKDAPGGKQIVAKISDETKEKGRLLFAGNCARCHSSQKPAGGEAPEEFYGRTDFLEVDDKGERKDWLGSEELTAVDEVLTNRCRSLHSNHMAGHVWDEFSTDVYKSRPNVNKAADVPELSKDKSGGRGYYRNISLLSLWTQAPFLHNNGIGPEICKPFNKQYQNGCVRMDGDLVSTEGRVKLYEESMRALLNPDKRGKKVDVLQADGKISLGSLSAKIKKGTPTRIVASMNLNKLVTGELAKASSGSASDRFKNLQNSANGFTSTPDNFVEFVKQNDYSNCYDTVEDRGHQFGADLSDEDKTALIEYMKLF